MNGSRWQPTILMAGRFYANFEPVDFDAQAVLIQSVSFDFFDLF